MPGRGIEPRTRGFSVDYLSTAIPHHFQVVKSQALTRLILDYIGLSWIIFGLEGYTLVTPNGLAFPHPYVSAVTPNAGDTLT